MSDIAGIDGLGQETKRKPPLTQHRSVRIGNSSYELPSNKIGAITQEEIAIHQIIQQIKQTKQKIQPLTPFGEPEMSENFKLVPVYKLTGPALDYTVARGAGFRVEHNYPYAEDYIFYGWWQFAPDCWQPLNNYSTVWSLGGPLVAREKVSLEIKHDGLWVASMKFNYLDEAEFMQCADSPLVAAMRCFVASKLGDKVKVPERLLNP